MATTKLKALLRDPAFLKAVIALILVVASALAGHEAGTPSPETLIPPGQVAARPETLIPPGQVAVEPERAAGAADVVLKPDEQMQLAMLFGAMQEALQQSVEEARAMDAQIQDLKSKLGKSCG